MEKALEMMEWTTLAFVVIGVVYSFKMLRLIRTSALWTPAWVCLVITQLSLAVRGVQIHFFVDPCDLPKYHWLHSSIALTAATSMMIFSYKLKNFFDTTISHVKKAFSHQRKGDRKKDVKPTGKLQ